jgi:hypothetical protein
MATSYTYSDLPGANSFRFLHLLPSSKQTPLEAELVTSELGRNCGYEALSYVWGDPDLSEALLVNGHWLAISKNLHTIMSHL